MTLHVVTWAIVIVRKLDIAGLSLVIEFNEWNQLSGETLPITTRLWKTTTLPNKHFITSHLFLVLLSSRSKGIGVTAPNKQNTVYSTLSACVTNLIFNDWAIINTSAPWYSPTSIHISESGCNVSAKSNNSGCIIDRINSSADTVWTNWTDVFAGTVLDGVFLRRRFLHFYLRSLAFVDNVRHSIW